MQRFKLQEEDPAQQRMCFDFDTGEGRGATCLIIYIFSDCSGIIFVIVGYFYKTLHTNHKTFHQTGKTSQEGVFVSNFTHNQ